MNTIRNFSIIAHIDHGKTTLTDRLIRATNTVSERDMSERMMDSNPIEKERGVTIKLAPVTMHYKLPLNKFEIDGSEYTLNLIDTPGHVDFAYEVERSLAACEAAVLLVDATQGVQAQTVAHTYKAVELGLHIIPVINKIDLPSAEVDRTLKELEQVFGFKAEEVSQLSAKSGQGVEALLARIIREVPPPRGQSSAPTRALVFNSTYDSHLGVIAFVRVVDGSLDSHQPLFLMQSKTPLEVREMGIFSPQRTPQTTLETGAVGYIATGLKDIRDLRVGDTVTVNLKPLATNQPLPGYKTPQHTVYADLYPADTTNFQELQDAIEKLSLTDASLSAKLVHSPVLGSGFRLGFLGVFHVEITKERLFREQGVSTILTNPTVEYTIITTTGQTRIIQNPSDLPDPTEIKEMKEPMTRATIMCPGSALGPLMEVLQNHRGVYSNTIYIGGRAQLTYTVPLAELISGLFDELKSASSGYATLDYELIEPAPVDAVKLIILLNFEEIMPLSRIVVRQKAEKVGRKLVAEIKELLPRHVFAIPIQAAIGGKIVARETKPAASKDVTAKLYGGDQTRKDKLLKKQKKGKNRLAMFGKVSIPDDVLTKLATLQ
ncbi:elongation factor 4 [Microgenomates group bacterium RIFCSPLOWO2_01_FULL_47_10]|nr:MAG: elongation factor 4 [Microgenomates group bacterium RIFCSPLOWO2_01_FULL_47_10]